LQILNNKAFSLIELIFVILIIAIISSNAIPKLLNSSKKSDLIKCRNDLYTIQNALNAYKIIQDMKNDTKTLNSLDNGNLLFENILENPIIASNKQWSKKNNTTYTYNFSTILKLDFMYDKNTLTFHCDKTKDLCKEILQ
jgi:general secretion pathway protein G